MSAGHMARGSIKVERFCSCGARLIATAADEDDAREKIKAFLVAHIGREPDGTVHRQLQRWQYWPMVRRKEAEQKRAAEKEAQRLMSEQAASAPRVRRYTIRRG